MRPVERGAAPRAYTDYNLALGDLYDVIGRHCSYCERPYSGAVEHVLPKLVHPTLKTTWGNFLLACGNCNSIKITRQSAGSAANAAAARALYLWPDTDNTARAFTFSRAVIAESAATPAGIQLLARDTMNLTGFHRIPGTTNPPKSKKDLRWKERNEAWDLADRKLVQIQADPSNDSLRQTVAELAAATGFWSVWRTVFAADPDMLLRFNAAFTGTYRTQFDAAGQPIQRPGGQL